MLYINDLVITSSLKKMIDTTKNDLTKLLNMIDLGLSQYYLGLDIWKIKYYIIVS